MRASDRAYSALREQILDGRLEPGTVLAEVEQSTRLGVSRTPLREALARLGADGLVSAHSGRGVVVTEVSVDRVAELFEVRGALEEQAARLAARRRAPRTAAG
jgi:DNA-binding GntR family transcriptional regulator